MTPAAAARRGAVDAQLGEQRRQAQLLQRPQARAARPPTLRGRTRRSESTSRGCTSVGPAAAPLACAPRDDQLPGDALGFVFDGVRAIGHQGRLAGQDVVDAGAQLRPLGLWGVEVAPEIEQGALPDGVSDALGVHQPMGEVGLPVLGPPGLGAANEHDVHDSGGNLPESTLLQKLWHYIARHQNPFLLESTTYRHGNPEIRPKSAK